MAVRHQEKTSRPPLVAGTRRSARRRHRARGRRRAIVGLVVLLALLPVLWSYGSAMLKPSNAGFGVRSVEWLRDNGMAWLVNDVEHGYYSLTAPDKGGKPLRSLPAVGVAPSSPARAARRSHARQDGTTFRPPPIPPIVHPALAGEGAWRATTRGGGGASPVLVTTYRPDPSYPRLIAGVAWIDTHRTRLALYPGRYEPPSGGPPGPLEVPLSQRPKLLATFNSGFKHKDSGGGFVAQGHTYAPLLPGAATLLEKSNGHVDVRAWPGGTAAARGVVLARQNLPLIVSSGRANPNLSDGPEWGATLGNAIRVWRSGVGVDRHGNLLYAAASDQTVSSLAAILLRAGARRAMELDINSEWVSLITYARANAVDPSNLLPSMTRAATRYLTPDDRDFFAVYRTSRP